VRVAIAVLAAVIVLVLAACGGDETTTTTVEALNLSEKEEIEPVGNEWAPLFANDDVAACDYMFAQPVCEKFYGRAGGEPAEVGSPSGSPLLMPPSSASRSRATRRRRSSPTASRWCSSRKPTSLGISWATGSSSNRSWLS
jgi:hypothetical protein